MSPQPTTVTCKACRRSLATITPEGLVPATSTGSECSTCKEFGALYEVMRGADEELAKVADKSDKNRVKQNALEASRMAHLIFGNWLHNVEAEVDVREEQQDSTKETHAPPETDTTHAPAVQRAHSHSPQGASREPESEGFDASFRSASPSARSRNLTIPLRLSPKRSHSESTLGHRKRLKFSDSVESPPAYREASQYARSSKEYEPGRYAPPEDGWLDTSGHVQGWVKFTRMKKSGKGWVEVPEGEETKKKGMKDDNTTTEPQESDYSAAQEDYGETDARTARLTRRSRRSLGTLAVPELQPEELDAQPTIEGGVKLLQGPIEVAEDRPLGDTSAKQADDSPTGTQEDEPISDHPTSDNTDNQGKETPEKAAEISPTSDRAAEPPQIQVAKEIDQESGSDVVLPPAPKNTNDVN